MQARLSSNVQLRQLTDIRTNVQGVPHVLKVYPLLIARCNKDTRPTINEVPDPENTIVAQPQIEAQPLVSLFEAERNDEDRETFVTAEGLVEEVEEEDAKVL